MNKIVIGDIVSRAWDLAVKHWPIFVVLTLISSLFSGMGVSFDENALTGLGQNPDPTVLAETITESITYSPWLIVGVLITVYLGFIIYRMYYNATVLGKPYDSFVDALKIDFGQFCIFFCVEAVVGLIIGLGLCFCVLPGIWLGVRLLFAPLIAAVENVGFGEAFSRSWNLTKGNFWSLLLLGITAIGIAILGLCACCVGIIFAEVIIEFMMMVAYVTLKAYNQPAAGQPIDGATSSADYVEVQP